MAASGRQVDAMNDFEHAQLIVSALKETGSVGLMALFLYAVWGQLRAFFAWLMAQNDKLIGHLLDDEKSA